MKSKIIPTVFLSLAFLILSILPVCADNDQQAKKTPFDASVKNPAYEKEKGPSVLFDEGHYNHQTISSGSRRYDGLGKTLENDGYVITINNSRFTEDVLKGHDILIISNALDERNAPWGKKGGRPPFFSAFLPEEIEAVHDWVKKGGGLLLVADHFPFGTAAFNLADKFGVIMDKGLTKEISENNKFTRENGKLLDHPITNGRNKSEKVQNIVTFTGQSLVVPEGSGFMRLGETAHNVNSSFKGKKSVAGHFVGAAFAYGAGRVVVLGEAGMLVARTYLIKSKIEEKSVTDSRDEQRKFKTMAPIASHYWGMDPKKNDNKKLLLNIVHYLSGILKPGMEVSAEGAVKASKKMRLHDPIELEAFLDGVMAAHMKSYHLLGTTVAVVKDGQLFFAKGYGYCDSKKSKPVDPDKTLFRIASVSKLFTATAVMQLVEQGKLDLKADINTYLRDLKIPKTFPEPITLAHLLTHTAGFKTELRISGPSSRELVPLKELLVNELPQLVRAPGDRHAYSNYAISLAGYIVERVSGISWEQYIEEKILKPLDMENTTAFQPVPARLSEHLSEGCKYFKKNYTAVPFEYQSHAPAASISATAADMAKFMIAHLQGGRYGKTRILKEQTIQDMHQRHYGSDSKGKAMAYGFFDMSQDNLHMIGHTGVTGTFHSILVLWPEHKVGLFVSNNTAGGAKARRDLLDLFLDRYFLNS